MARFFCVDTQAWWCKWASRILALLWTLGLLCGIFVFRSAGDSISTLMRRAVSSPVSIVSLLISLLLPFLFSALAVYLSKLQFLPIIAFCKAFLMMYISLGTRLAFGSAGWLVQILLMAGDFAALPLLYRYWMQHIGADGKFRPMQTAMYGLAVIAAGYLDYFYVSPVFLGLF